MKEGRRWGLFNTSAFRMSMGYTFLVTLAVCVTLGSAYLLTQSIITSDVDLIIDTELKSLENQYVRSGIPGVTDEINLRIDSWGRIGAVYMLADPKFNRLAGNVTNWPFDGAPADPWPSFASSPSSRDSAPFTPCGPPCASSRTATGCSSAPTCRRIAGTCGPFRSPRSGASAYRSWRPALPASRSASASHAASGTSPIPACGSCRASRGTGFPWSAPAMSSMPSRPR